MQTQPPAAEPAKKVSLDNLPAFPDLIVGYHDDGSVFQSVVAIDDDGQALHDAHESQPSHQGGNGRGPPRRSKSFNVGEKSPKRRASTLFMWVVLSLIVPSNLMSLKLASFVM